MSETLIEHPPQTLIDHSDTGRSTPVGNTHTAIRNDDAFDRTAAVTIPGLLPSKVFERTRWQRQYAAKLRITDTMVVCAAVALAQYARFGPTSHPPGYVKYYVPGFSVLFMIIWLVALAGFRSRSPRLTGTGIEEYRRVLTASFWTFGAIAIVALLLKLDIARGYLAVALPSGALGLVLTRAMRRGYLPWKLSQTSSCEIRWMDITWWGSAYRAMAPRGANTSR
jgi:hypothetical protein